MSASTMSLKNFQKQQLKPRLTEVQYHGAWNAGYISFCFYFCILILVGLSPEMSIHMQCEVSFSFPVPKIMHYHLFTTNRHELLPQWSCVRAGKLMPISAQHKHTLRQNRWKHNNAIHLTMHVHLLSCVTGKKMRINKNAASQELCWTEQGIELSHSVLLFITPQISLITSQCKGSDKKWMWMEGFVNIQEIMPKICNKFLRNENSELQSQLKSNLSGQ